MRIRVLAVGITLLAAACGDDAASSTTLADTTTPPATTVAAESMGGAVVVHAEGVRWELPAAVCGAPEGDREAVAVSGFAAADEVMALVADRALGWPTTTRALEGDDAAFFVAVNRAGITAWALATLAGTTALVAGSWEDFADGYADLEGSPGPVTAIAIRLPGWQEQAAAIVAAVPGACG